MNVLCAETASMVAAAQAEAKQTSDLYTLNAETVTATVRMYTS